MAHKMNAHLGAVYRMYNDYGSIVRDREERNPNSVNFPEFFPVPLADLPAIPDARYSDAIVKATLLDTTEYERRCAMETVGLLL